MCLLHNITLHLCESIVNVQWTWWEEEIPLGIVTLFEISYFNNYREIFNLSCKQCCPFDINEDSVISKNKS